MLYGSSFGAFWVPGGLRAPDIRGYRACPEEELKIYISFRAKVYCFQLHKKGASLSMGYPPHTHTHSLTLWLLKYRQKCTQIICGADIISLYYWDAKVCVKMNKDFFTDTLNIHLCASIVSLLTETRVTSRCPSCQQPENILHKYFIKLAPQSC